MSADLERAELFARLPLEALRRARNEAAARGDLRMADEAVRALSLRGQLQTPELQDCGQLFEHIEEPSRANGWRGSVRYTGDPMAWMAQFCAGGQFGSINRTPAVVARKTLDLRSGDRVQIIGSDGLARTA